MAVNPFEILDRELHGFISSRPFLELLGKKVIDIIRKRTQSGYGVDDDSSPNPSQVRLKSFSTRAVKISGKFQTYEQFRRNVVLGEYGSPSRSNATLTGQMLQSLRFNASGSTLTIDVAPTSRSPIRVKKGDPIRQDQTNKEVSDKYSERRPYLALTEDEQRILIQYADELIQKFLDQRFK